MGHHHSRGHVAGSLRGVSVNPSSSRIGSAIVRHIHAWSFSSIPSTRSCACSTARSASSRRRAALRGPSPGCGVRASRRADVRSSPPPAGRRGSRSPDRWPRPASASPTARRSPRPAGRSGASQRHRLTLTITTGPRSAAGSRVSSLGGMRKSSNPSSSRTCSTSSSHSRANAMRRSTTLPTGVGSDMLLHSPTGHPALPAILPLDDRATGRRPRGTSSARTSRRRQHRQPVVITPRPGVVRPVVAPLVGRASDLPGGLHGDGPQPRERLFRHPFPGTPDAEHRQGAPAAVEHRGRHPVEGRLQLARARPVAACPGGGELGGERLRVVIVASVNAGSSSASTRSPLRRGGTRAAPYPSRWRATARCGRASRPSAPRSA